MKKVIILLFILALLPGVLAFQGSKLDVTNLQVLEEGEEITLALELHNRNSIDARDIAVDFYLSGEKLSQTFPDLNTGEKKEVLYTFDSQDATELVVVVHNDELRHEAYFTLAETTEDTTTVVVSEEPTTTEENDWLDNLLAFIFGK